MAYATLRSSGWLIHKIDRCWGECGWCYQLNAKYKSVDYLEPYLWGKDNQLRTGPFKRRIRPRLSPTCPTSKIWCLWLPRNERRAQPSTLPPSSHFFSSIWSKRWGAECYSWFSNGPASMSEPLLKIVFARIGRMLSEHRRPSGSSAPSGKLTNLLKLRKILSYCRELSRVRNSCISRRRTIPMRWKQLKLNSMNSERLLPIMTSSPKKSSIIWH